MINLINLPGKFNGSVNLDYIREWTDKYFTKTRAVTEAEERRLGTQIDATYAVFIRQPAVFAPAYMLTWMNNVAAANGFKFKVDLMYNEGEQMIPGDPMMFIHGRMSELVELETHFLQKIGPACIAAYNAKNMAASLPGSKFLAMDVRHDVGMEMAEVMAYAASVGSKAAQKQGALGFIGNATDGSAHYFGNEKGFGTMPHALIGLFEDTLSAAKAYHAQFPDEPMTVLVDFHGKEVTDSISIAKSFPDMLKQGKISVRIDTNGARYLEGLDHEKSYRVLEKNCPKVLNEDLSESQIQDLVGRGVSAAAVWHLRNELDNARAQNVKIVASSGFNADKCKIMAKAEAPIDVVGTGSFLPQKWPDTYATADIVEYRGTAEGTIEKVKVGRQYLIEQRHKRAPVQTLELG